MDSLKTKILKQRVLSNLFFIDLRVQLCLTIKNNSERNEMINIKIVGKVHNGKTVIGCLLRQYLQNLGFSKVNYQNVDNDLELVALELTSILAAIKSKPKINIDVFFDHTSSSVNQMCSIDRNLIYVGFSSEIINSQELGLLSTILSAILRSENLGIVHQEIIRTEEIIYSAATALTKLRGMEICIVEETASFGKKEETL